MTLSVKEIEHAKPNDRDRKLYDEKGLYLLIATSGSRRWYLKYRFLGSEKKLGLGHYPEVSLKAARAKRDAARALIDVGKDPSQERQTQRLLAKAATDNTFGVVGREFLDKRAADGLAETTKSKSEWLFAQLEPQLGKMPVSEITAPILLSVLQAVVRSGRLETARRLRSLAGRIMRHAVVTGRAERNPATDLQRALVAPKVRHHPAIIDAGELGALLRAINNYEGYPSTIGALKLSPHLFQRPGEIRAMRWSELDLDRAKWVIPAERTKMRRPHEVPLSWQAIEIIESMRPISGIADYVFPAFHSRTKPISENTVNQALRRLGYKGAMTAHGFRSTASSLLNESERWSPDVIERTLAHQDQNAVRATYNRASYWKTRVEMMQWWSDHLDTLRAAAGE
ncbi:integrase [Sphingomonas melonis TY]|uniref:Integrase n=1 Tax=Sphingomonas melonis TY TaxID=621456 RepID=A0A175XZY3_9SPHN|nr:integrase arm-type DNA-binding domain-containing protein [Sphingomonas melonis]AOW22839.1 integrase [Sphingomonas melonis TY]KZB93759.1 integrase [Sphingomonas melonis TY]